jgi:hypothetical protein
MVDLTLSSFYFSHIGSKGVWTKTTARICIVGTSMAVWRDVSYFTRARLLALLEQYCFVDRRWLTTIQCTADTTPKNSESK